ncbi:MAG TPA: DNA-processing protein DprA [Firmicutes bacterium]|nr:DNA-processing protein DprA [Bacillota bacterium]
MVDRDRLFQRACNYFALWELTGRRPQVTANLWSRITSITDVNEPLPLELGTMIDIPDWTPARIRNVQKQVERAMKEVLRRGSDHILEKGTPQYPRLLGQIDGAPEFLFARGNLELLDRPALAVVGTRNASEEGLRRASKLACLLVNHGIVVVSGLARGIDTAAHRGALSVGTETIAVIGTPLGITYPPENADLQKQIEKVGLVVTQFYPGAGIRRHYFPMRNAVMSGLCLGTVIVEASEHSGALIQARQCLKQGRKLFIPKSAVENPGLRWPKEYLKKGACEFSTIEELMGILRNEHLLPPENKPVCAESLRRIKMVL